MLLAATANAWAIEALFHEHFKALDYWQAGVFHFESLSSTARGSKKWDNFGRQDKQVSNLNGTLWKTTKQNWDVCM